MLEQSKLAVKACGLDFGAVDIIWNNHYQKAYVLEINTAPGLEGSSVDNYRKAFEGYNLEELVANEQQRVEQLVGNRRGRRNVQVGRFPWGAEPVEMVFNDAEAEPEFEDVEME